MFEIFYKAKFCGGPMDGFVETQRAVNGILLDAIGRSHPGESGFEFARYVRDGFPDSEGVVRYNWDACESDSPPPIDIARRLRQTRADMIGSDDEQHYRDCQDAAGEIERLRRLAALTDAEREAIETSFDALQYAADELGLGQGDCDRLAATLRGLLKRTRNGAVNGCETGH